MNNQTELVDLLQETFADQTIDSLEKATLFDAFKPLAEEQRAYVRNRAFDIVKQFSRENPTAPPPYKWLEQIIKSLDSTSPVVATAAVYFSPGDSCLNALLNMINRSVHQLQVCVFTISDNRLRDALLKAYQRGVDVRIITDNDKTEDLGSDIEWLERHGLAVRVDQTRYHMHHKFAIADQKTLATGSFNWTMSATRYNHENVLMTDDAKIIADCSEEFERLWQNFND
jgi:mitochondrial cardiolipin hydrolase